MLGGDFLNVTLVENIGKNRVETTHHLRRLYALMSIVTLI
jgi:hypothetical protein